MGRLLRVPLVKVLHGPRETMRQPDQNFSTRLAKEDTWDVRGKYRPPKNCIHLGFAVYLSSWPRGLGVGTGLGCGLELELELELEQDATGELVPMSNCSMSTSKVLLVAPVTTPKHSGFIHVRHNSPNLQMKYTHIRKQK